MKFENFRFDVSRWGKAVFESLGIPFIFGTVKSIKSYEAARLRIFKPLCFLET